MPQSSTRTLLSARQLITLSLLATLAACSTPAPPTQALPAEADKQCKVSPGAFSIVDAHRVWEKALATRNIEALGVLYSERPVHVDGAMPKEERSLRFRDQVIAHLIQRLDGQTIERNGRLTGGDECGTGFTISEMTLVDSKGGRRDVTYMLYWTLDGTDWKVQAEYFGQSL
jgi:hypothetical protein